MHIDKMKIFILFISLIFAGCTAQNFVPVRPLQKGENEVRWSLNYSLNSYDFGGYQFAAFHGITNEDVLGLAFTGILPGSISYAHYWKKNDSYQNFQVHLNDLFATGYNPTYEVDYGFTTFHDRTFNSFKIGIGLYHTSLIHLCVGRAISQSRFVPILGYRFQHNELNLDAQLIYGMTNYFIRYYTGDYLSQEQNDDISWMRATKVVLHRSEIDSIYKFEDEYESGYKVALKSKKDFTSI